MFKRWLLYLVCVLGFLIFFAAYQGWIAWILLVCAALLPGFSLLVSLVPMLLVRVEVRCPAAVTRGETAALTVLLSSPLPLPPTFCQYRLRNSFTGEQLTYSPNSPLPLDHCGLLTCQSSGLYIYDYLGMFRIRRKLPTRLLRIRPRPVPMEPPRDLERQLALSWRPKHGGGFAENHELRLYRPGDSLNQIHWKLSAKTGNLIIREPMLPQHRKILLTADLAGSTERLDRILGRLLWMGSYLLDQGLDFELHILTGNGPQICPIADADALARALDTLLRRDLCTGGTIRDHGVPGAWHCYIGGDADEV